MNQSFLQSRAWEEFQKKLGRKTWRIEDQLIIRHKLPAGFNYLYSPRPKLVNNNLLSGVEKIAKKEKSIFLKIDPAENLQSTIHNPQPTNSIQPQKTLILDIGRPEDDLFADMRPKTRYNIRLAERHGVYITPKRILKDFWDLLQETSRRDKFNIHSQDHYKKLLDVSDQDFSNELFFAQYDNKIIAVGMINFYKPSGTATYLHGASSSQHREIMAPHLLHWRVIQEAKARGFKYYDFWGVDEKKWPGLTRFKLGFGGEQVEYPPSIDIIYRPALYKLYRLARFIL